MKSSIPNKKIKGFTLIEFLVASSLALIVIMAAGSTYFFTRRLNDTNQARVDKQNALRNAAIAISRDARVAGTFGCFVTGGAIAATGAGATGQVANSGTFPTFTAGGTTVRLNNSDNQGYGVATIDAGAATAMINPSAGIDLTGQMLVFVYGKGNSGVVANNTGGGYVIDSSRTSDPDVIRAQRAGGETVLSSCRNAYSGIPAASGSYNYSAPNIEPEQFGEVSESAMYAVGYVMGTIRGATGTSLLRFETGANGQWDPNPQLLVSDIEGGMTYSFAYANGCNIAVASPAVPMGGVRFDSYDTLSQYNLPALIQIVVDYENNLPPYVINANVRGGNACANIGRAAN